MDLRRCRGGGLDDVWAEPGARCIRGGLQPTSSFVGVVKEEPMMRTVCRT
jgi:hypothetical protein